MLPALVGAGVSSLTGRGTVVSAYPGAVNVLHSEGLIVSLVEETRAMTTLSVCLSPPFPGPVKGLVPGDRICFDGHRLVAKDLVVVLLGRPTWEGTLRPAHAKGLGAWKLALLKRALLKIGREGGFLGLLRPHQPVNPFVEKAREGLRHTTLSGLVGLGPGSTPSGDDFITGVLLGEETLKQMPAAAAKAFAGRRKALIPGPLEKQSLWAALNRTNHAGRTLLWQALQGHFPGYLIEMVRSLSDAKGREEVAGVVERSVRCGETSGTDALTGFLLFMEGGLWNSRAR